VEMKKLKLPLVLACTFICGSSPAIGEVHAQGNTRNDQHGRTTGRSDLAVVNINTATPDQLRLLPRIGPSKAQAIITYRQKRPFRTTYDLVRVKGIGRRTYAKLRPYLTVKGPTTMKSRPNATR
jgi:comEA protein